MKKDKSANIFYSQILSIKETWEIREKSSQVVYHSEISQYNDLLKKASTEFDKKIDDYNFSDVYLNSSDRGNQFTFPSTLLFNVRNLQKYLEGKYQILSPELSFITDNVLKDKYQLYLFNKDKNPDADNDAISSVTLEFEDRLRKLASLPNTSTGTDLANKALNPTTGKLTLKNGGKKSKEGYYNLVKGFFDYIRGDSHHVKTKLGRAKLFREIMLVDKLINEFDNLIERV